jgi:PIN domain nuclease of toxin-antitoxin system
LRLLLDTPALIWAVAAPARLSPKLRGLLVAPENAVFVSAASAWEIAIKQALGRLDFPLDRWDEAVGAAGFVELPIRASHAIAAGALPRHHGDPFDRLLLAQAAGEGLVLVSRDAALAPYGIPLLPA